MDAGDPLVRPGVADLECCLVAPQGLVVLAQEHKDTSQVAQSLQAKQHMAFAQGEGYGRDEAARRGLTQAQYMGSSLLPQLTSSLQRPTPSG